MAAVPRWWVTLLWFTGMAWCGAVQVTVQDGRRFALLFQSVVLPCQYSSSSTQTAVVQWWYKSYCRDRTRDAFSFPESLGVKGSELGPTSHLDCSDSARTVRIVASRHGSAITLPDYYKDRDISIINNADLRIGEIRWGDSGVYYCKVVISDDLNGPNEAQVELLVLEWAFVGAVILGSVLFVLLVGVCWCQCCPHSCCCYVRCCCCPETCCCPRHLYEAGKGIKTVPPTPMTLYPPYYVQGLPSMVPIPPPSLIESKLSPAPSITNNISTGQQPSVHSVYRLQPTPDQSSLKVLQYMETELAQFNPSKSLSSHNSCNMSELSSLHEADTHFRQTYRQVQKKALPAILDLDDPPDMLSREISPVHAQRAIRHHRLEDDYPRWKSRSEHLQRKAYELGGRTGSLEELEDFAMGYIPRGRGCESYDGEDDYRTRQMQSEREREWRREQELERDRYPYYGSKRFYPGDDPSKSHPPTSSRLPKTTTRQGAEDGERPHPRRDPGNWNDEDGHYDDTLLNSLLQQKARGRSLSSKSARNEDGDTPSKTSSKKSYHSSGSASHRAAEDDSLPPYSEQEQERSRRAATSQKPSITSHSSRKDKDSREEQGRPRKVNTLLSRDSLIV